MVKNLTKHGNSYALVIDKPILDMLQISPDTPLELSSNGDALLISPIRKPARQQKLQGALNKINQKYGADLKRLSE